MPGIFRSFFYGRAPSEHDHIRKGNLLTEICSNLLQNFQYVLQYCRIVDCPILLR